MQMPPWAHEPRILATVGLAAAALFLAGSQLLGWVTSTLTTGFEYDIAPWMLTAPVAFSSGGLPFTDSWWWDLSDDGTPRIWFLRIAGPLLALATIVCGLAAYRAWRGNRNATIVAAAVAAFLALAAVVLIATAAPAFNGRLPAGRYTTALGPGGVFSVLGMLCATIAAAAAWRLPAPVKSAEPEGIATTGSGWLPPPGFDAKTGLYVGDRKGD